MARCPKLAGQLRSGMKESQSGEVRISYHSYHVFRMLLEVSEEYDWMHLVPLIHPSDTYVMNSSCIVIQYTSKQTMRSIYCLLLMVTTAMKNTGAKTHHWALGFPPFLVEYMLDRLKMMCEEVVEHAVSDDNVAQLLEAAEQYNARRLRSVCIAHVAAKPDLIMSSSFLALPDHILADLRAFLPSWNDVLL